MSNLRSDCRDIAGRLPVGDIHRVHIEALCHQIDTIEETWHAAERKARDALAKLELWQWMARMGLNVCRNAVIGSPEWFASDIDGDAVGWGYSPEDAIRQSRIRVEGEDWEERQRRHEQRLNQGKGGA